MDGLMRQKLEHREQRIAFAELRESVRQESERVEREQATSTLSTTARSGGLR
jgi:hypothetical protein